MFTLLKGSKEIGKYLGLTPEHTRAAIFPQLRERGLIFKMNNKKHSPYVTSPYFLHLFYFLLQTERDKDKPTN